MSRHEQMNMEIWNVKSLYILNLVLECTRVLLSWVVKTWRIAPTWHARRGFRNFLKKQLWALCDIEVRIWISDDPTEHQGWQRPEFPFNQLDSTPWYMLIGHAAKKKAKQKSLQHMRFPRGPPPEYWACLRGLSFAVRMRYSVLPLVWPQTKTLWNKTYRNTG